MTEYKWVAASGIIMELLNVFMDIFSDIFPPSW